MTPVLGVDWGERRIGLAVSDPSRTVARPVETLDTRGLRESVALIAGKARDLEAGLILIGLPVLPSGQEGDSARKARKLGQRLESKGFRVVYRDERHSSADARERVRELGGVEAQGATVDAAAAALVLQAYLDEEVA